MRALAVGPLIMPAGTRVLDGIFGKMLDPLLRVPKRSEAPKEPSLPTVKGTLSNREKAQAAATSAVRTRNPLDRVPPGVKAQPLNDMDNIAQGERFQWTDDLGRHQLRIHDADTSAGPNTNAGRGKVYRISHGDRFYEDVDGNIHDVRVANTRSANHDPDFGNKTHIPWPTDVPHSYGSTKGVKDGGIKGDHGSAPERAPE
ncbi:polymorphic toxin type 30 domain-containing protein [Propionibacteriaceae bacterium Y1700]|uniref:polymorphic toxin type 30 domain-containing protein n=1 Tax=Microlunatus sp. Y1700 TaxID=3418487 RepID=UPI003DA75B39